jgi:5-methylcytosine-specific restriction endonuclease McrA
VTERHLHAAGAGHSGRSDISANIEDMLIERMSTWGQGSTRASRKARTAVLNRDHHICRLQLACCTFTATEAHHVESITGQGVSRAQATEIEDMVAACSSCHQQVTEQQRKAAWRADQQRRHKRRHLPQTAHPGEW